MRLLSEFEEARGKKPFKIWDCSRSVRKGLVVTSFDELIHRGKEKLSVSASEQVRVVLESDGTQVEDNEYWRTLPSNTVLLLLRPGERWHPVGADVVKKGFQAIPKIICETIVALDLQDETPSWKIMDNKGRVTVVLHWDQRNQGSPAPGTRSPSKKADARPALVIQTSLDKTNYVGVLKDAEYVGASGSAGTRYGPQITVINHDEQTLSRARLARQGGSLESAVHVHTADCERLRLRPRPGSPATAVVDECDFHCCALHEEGRRIAVQKSVATSPIRDPSPQPGTQPGEPPRRAAPKGHVRFLDAEAGRGRADRDSSESETENTVVEDEAITSEKFLLLIDQLSVDQKRHLTIKDIGIILERLSSKILDVERLDRESESDDCYNWTIKATIRGDVLRELGVIYNGNYYAISEHPGYKEENEEGAEEAEEEEEEDRL